MEKSLENIIFLDIDGVVICTPQYSFDKMCSFNRTHFNTSAIGWLKILLQHIPNVKIVLNSTHNRQFKKVPDIKQCLISNGIPVEAFHENDRTDYPSIERGLAVKKWLKENSPRAKWIAFDDCDFTGEPNLILVDFDDGIDRDAFNRALAFFDITNKFIVL